ncbi:MAG: S8 family serine peptidase [Deltaproteobacteria bacterium]|nr:S8 family serine peptidase [Deltaproteobacteria bacterium]
MKIRLYKIYKYFMAVTTMFVIIYSCPQVYAGSSFRPAGLNPEKCRQLDISVKNDLVFMDVKDAPYECVVRQMLEKCGVGFKVWDAGNRRVTLKLEGVSIETAVKSICVNYAIVYDYLPQTRQYRFAAVAVAPKSRASSPGFSDNGRAFHAHPEKSAPVSARQIKNQEADSELAETLEKTVKKSSRPKYRPGEIIVRFKPEVSIARINELNAFIGAKVKKKIGRSNIYNLYLDDDAHVPKAMEFYKASGLVVSVGRNLIRYKMSGPIPDDPYFSDKWGLAIADATDAWKIEKGDSSVVVGVIDTGVDYTHPDLVDNIWINVVEKNGQPGVDDDGNGYIDDIYGYDFADNDADPMDNDGHGTHVAGIIGAIADNGVGVAGVCRHVRIMVLKVQSDTPDGLGEFEIIEAMEYAKEKGVHIFNCSYGGPIPDNTAPDSTDEYVEMESFRAINGIFICAAGNDGINTDIPGKEEYPADYNLDNIISVAASTESDTLAGFSNYGAATVDLMAPGVDILSTYPTILASTNSGAIIEAVITVKDSSERILGESMEFAGTIDSSGIHGKLYNCGYGYPDEIPSEVSGNIALIKRGGSAEDVALFFSQKVENVQSKGAVGAVIYNNIGGNFSGTLGSAGNWIPAISVSDEDGLLLLGFLATAVDINSDAYARLSGTSMATPFVTGLAALLVSKKPDIKYLKIISDILDNVDPISGVEGKILTGGRVNFYHTLGALLTPGDLTGDGRVDLDDLVLCMQILDDCALKDSFVFHPVSSDVNGDKKIGLQEETYIFRKLVE